MHKTLRPRATTTTRQFQAASAGLRAFLFVGVVGVVEGMGAKCKASSSSNATQRRKDYQRCCDALRCFAHPWRNSFSVCRRCLHPRMPCSACHRPLYSLSVIFLPRFEAWQVWASSSLRLQCGRRHKTPPSFFLQSLMRRPTPHTTLHRHIQPPSATSWCLLGLFSASSRRPKICQHTTPHTTARHGALTRLLPPSAMD
jgi:hypothetical protein